MGRGRGGTHHLIPPGSRMLYSGQGSQDGKGVIGHPSWAPSWASGQVLSLPSLGTYKWRLVQHLAELQLSLWVGIRVLQVLNIGSCNPTSTVSPSAQCLKASCPSGPHRAGPSLMPSMTFRETPPLLGKCPCSSAYTVPQALANP